MLNKKEEQIMCNWSIKSTDNPVVSVRCMAYNHEKYIEQALDGFLMQETDFPFEIVIHDDASKDKTAEIIRKYEKKFPKIVKPIYQTENQFSKCLKNGTSLSKMLDKYLKGKFIAVCEGDDYWCDAKKLQKQYDFMIQHPECSMCLHNTVFHYIDGSHEDRNFNKWSTIHKMTEDEVFFGWDVHTSSYFYRSDFDFFPKIREGFWSGDYAQLTLALYYGDVYVLPDVMSVYNANNTAGVTVQNMRKASKARLKIQSDRAKYLNDYNVYTDYKFDEIIQARLAEITIKSSDDYKELKQAAKKMSKNRYCKAVCSTGNFLSTLKNQWKFKGYIFGRLWYLTVLLQHKRKN